MHLNRIKNNNDNNKDICKEMNNTRPVVICDNIKNTNKKLINKVHIENNSGNTITKKTHIKVFNNVSKKVKSINNTHADYDKYKKLFNNVLKQIKQVNKVHTKTSNAFIDLDICKEAHKKLFINVLNELKSNNMHIQKSAGHKDSSANIINEVHIRDINNDVLLHNHILYHASKINNMHKCINNNQKNIASTLSNIYHDDIDTQFNKLREVNDKLNSLLNSKIKLFSIKNQLRNKLF